MYYWYASTVHFRFYVSLLIEWEKLCHKVHISPFSFRSFHIILSCIDKGQFKPVATTSSLSPTFYLDLSGIRNWNAGWQSSGPFLIRYWRVGPVLSFFCTLCMLALCGIWRWGCQLWNMSYGYSIPWKQWNGNGFFLCLYSCWSLCQLREWKGSWPFWWTKSAAAHLVQAPHQPIYQTADFPTSSEIQGKVEWAVTVVYHSVSSLDSGTLPAFLFKCQFEICN